MINTLDKVKEFQKLFNQPVYESYIIPSEDRIKLRLKLCLEELSELAEASASLIDFKKLLELKLEDVNNKIKNKQFIIPNINEILDALIDMRYVNDGTIHEFGLSNIFEKDLI